MHYQRKMLSWATWLAVAVSGSAAAQQPGIFGIYNPATGQFQPAPVQMAAPTKSEAPTPSAPVARTGILHVNLTIAIKNGTPSTSMPSCYLSVYHQPSGHSYSQSASKTGTRISNTGHCNFVIYYSWPKADTAYPVTFYLSVNVGSWGGAVPIDAIPLPADGATTTVTAVTTL